MARPSSNNYDVIVIGAGPAGSAAATVLAENNRRVCVLEKARFPRYRVGESLVPYCWFPLNRLGMVDKLRQSHFTKKYSVQFVSLTGRVSTPFYFSQHTDHDCANTWQVVRSEFDQMLLDNARDRGAEVMMATAATELIAEEGRVTGVDSTGPGGNLSLHAPVTIDASGRDLFTVSRKGWRVPDAELKKIAIWTYYTGAARDEGLDEGATTVAYLPERGWFWYIPLPEDLVSVGIVADRDYLYRGRRDPEHIFDREVELQPWIRQHLDTGQRIEKCYVTGDYSYRSQYCAANGLVLAGDAFTFLDPVFSSGVFLALQSGIMAGDAVDAALRTGDVSARRFADYGRELCAGVEAMRNLVYAFYDANFSFGKLLRSRPDLRGDLTDCLIGNLFKDFSPLFDAVAKFAQLPTPVAHGGVAGQTF